jgi:hypothetical protein
MTTRNEAYEKADHLLVAAIRDFDVAHPDLVAAWSASKTQDNGPAILAAQAAYADAQNHDPAILAARSACADARDKN